MNKKVPKWLFVVIGIIALMAIVGIRLRFTNVMPRQDHKLKVTASFYPMYYFAQQIGSDKADVTNVTPAGAEPHDYEPSPQDMAIISDSRLLILNGLGLEPWGNKIQQNIDSKQTLIVTAGDGISAQHVNEDGQIIVDPHIWLSPILAEQMVDKILQGFIKVDPSNSQFYSTNAAALKSKLADLDNEYKNGLQACANTNIVTSHAAFGYLATAYHLNQMPITGLSPDSEPSPQQLADIAKFAKDNNVKYIFFESLVSPKLAQTIATEIGAQTMVLNPIEGLTKDEIAQGKIILPKWKPTWRT